MDVKLVLGGVALLALAAGCSGGRSATTRLTIRVNDAQSARVFELECDPVGGSMRNAAAACRALRRQPRMLRPPELVVCGPGATSKNRIRVTGTDRGKSVSAEFSGACSSSGDGFGAWDDVLYRAGPGSPAT
jgi:hypothetical protein